VITLLSDFGLDDPYVAQMKGLILSNVSDAEIVDISHGIQKHNIAAGSFVLETTASFFPNGSIHVAVVDPGVGGPRLPIAIDCDQGILIGPDNGLMARAADRLGVRAAYEISNRKFAREYVSSTFHGRDIFAYAAATVSREGRTSEVGPKVQEIVQLDIPSVDVSSNQVSCSVLYVDSFGNVVTNVPADDLGRLDMHEGRPVRILRGEGEGQYKGIATVSYFDVPPGRLGLLLGSQGYLEIALKEASAAAKLRVKPLDRLTIRIS
jgi:S-adenosylmethionine hydrolase